MLFLDANLVIYFVEQPPVWGPKSIGHITALLAAGDQLAVTDLVRMECLVGPLKNGDINLEADYRKFFSSSDVHILAITGPVCDRAAAIRATYGFKPLDSLHLAAAVEYGCARFLTNDGRLNSFPDISVEALS
jgi:uncharacterized protein